MKSPSEDFPVMSIEFRSSAFDSSRLLRITFSASAAASSRRAVAVRAERDCPLPVDSVLVSFRSLLPNPLGPATGRHAIGWFSAGSIDALSA